MSDKPALSAAFASFHVKSSSTSLVTVLVTVRVLPFFLTVTLTCSGTPMVSTLGARWYATQRYWSMQISATMHSLGVSAEISADFVSFCTGGGVVSFGTGSGVLADAT